ncbi:MAG: 4-hydroxythreonine-4-phosphate dehydrogenase PdxA [Bacteroidia bacterium]
MSDSNKIIVGISQGDLNGVGLETVIKTFSDPAMLDICTPVIFSGHKMFNTYKKQVGAEEFNVHFVKDNQGINHKRVNVVSFTEEDIQLEAGKINPAAGKFALASIDAACEALQNNTVDVLVTAPVDKNAIEAVSPGFKGHTEYLQAKLGASDSLMILMSGDLRVGLVTGHLPLRDVANAVTKEKIEKKVKLMAKSLLEDFGIRKPKIAVLGLNPHAGDQGTLGKEELEIIIPAIESLKSQGVLAFGPYPADGFFGSGNWKNFDGIMAMYHDQGLAPFKAVSFAAGVNYTAGLPFVRTSPDHGTATNIAFSGKADESSFRTALYTAIDIYRQRVLWNEISADPLKFQPRQKDYKER